MDGNGRWASQRGRPRLYGHRAGTENIRRVIERFADYGVGYLTLFAFSTENWDRPRYEVRGLMALNLLYLALIAFLPFPTGIFGDHASLPLRIVFQAQAGSVDLEAFRRELEAGHGGDVLAARDVDGYSARRCAGFGDLPGHGFGGGAIDVGDVDMCTFSGKRFGDRTADARAGSGDQGDAALKTFHRSLAWAAASAWPSALRF